MNKMLNIFGLGLIFLLALLCISGCNAENNLKQRTVRYHNYIFGHGSTRDKLSNYWSPALVTQYKSQNKLVNNKSKQKNFTNFDYEQERLNQLNEHNSGFTKISKPDVDVLMNKKWAVSIIKRTQGLPEGLKYRWVQVNNRWYIYKGTVKEVEDYGKFVYPSR